MAERLWDFHCRAERLDNGRFRVELTSASGRRIVREGYHPLWELVRALGADGTDGEDVTIPLHGRTAV